MSAVTSSLKGSSVCRSSRRHVAFKGTGRLPVAVVRASAEPAQSNSGNKMVFNKVAPLTWDVDTETPKEVFAFAGSAPERANGRCAMLGFASLALTELSSHTPALEQASNSIFGIILVSLTLSVATVMPKLVSGTSLKELHNAASAQNLKAEGLFGQFLAMFDQSLELWSGRLAMIGVVGLVVTETFKGDALF